MSFMRGDVLTKARKLVKGLAMSEPIWLKAMQQAPPATFPRVNEIKRITLPEDVYVKKFYKKHPDSLHEDAFKFRGLDPPPARVFAQRVLQLKDHGVSEEDAMAVADMEYRMERKGKKKAYSRLKQIAKLQGKKPPPNPYPSAIKEIQALERPFVRARFCDPEIRKIAKRLEEERAAEMQERGWGGFQERGGGGFEEKGGGDFNFQGGNGAGFQGRGGGGFPGRGGGFQGRGGGGFQERGGGFF